MPSRAATGERLAAQRVDAEARLSVAQRAGRTRLVGLYEGGAARVRIPDTGADPMEAVLINTAGGLTGGDRIGWTVSVGERSSLTLTTQACEKLYRCDYGAAAARVRLDVGAGGRIAWLPQETIAYDGSSFARTLEVDLAAGAQALILEATVFGRSAMGERVGRASFRDDWRVRREGRLIHAEAFRIGPDIAASLGRRAVTGGGIAVATLLMVAADCAERLDAVRGIIGDAGGASAWSVAGCGKLLARIVASDGYELRRRLSPLIGLLNGSAGLPRIWSL